MAATDTCAVCGPCAQGSHECYSKFQNFFRFRLSPLVSGFVYTAYLVYILTLLPKAFDYHNNAVAKVGAGALDASTETGSRSAAICWPDRRSRLTQSAALLITRRTHLSPWPLACP